LQVRAGDTPSLMKSQDSLSRASLRRSILDLQSNECARRVAYCDFEKFTQLSSPGRAHAMSRQRICRIRLLNDVHPDPRFLRISLELANCGEILWWSRSSARSRRFRKVVAVGTV